MIMPAFETCADNDAGNQQPEELRVLTLPATATDTNVVALTSRLMNQYRPQAVAKGLRLFSLLPDSAPPVRLDPLRLQMVVAHLLDNAVKFTVSGSIKVTLVTDLETRQPTGLIIADTGVGIPADAQRRIFLPREPFADATHQSDYGAGLGLSLTLELCEAMGCCLTLTSEVGQGSRFTIRFPNG